MAEVDQMKVDAPTDINGNGEIDKNEIDIFNKVKAGDFMQLLNVLKKYLPLLGEKDGPSLKDVLQAGPENIPGNSQSVPMMENMQNAPGPDAEMMRMQDEAKQRIMMGQ